MITQGVIAAALVGIVLTGLIPAIGGIVLMAMHKIKASSFWAGVLAYIIGIIVAGIIIFIVGLSVPDMIINKPVMYGVITAIIQAVMLSLSMSVCIKSCMKTRTFNAALSCGLGFGVSYAVTLAIGFASMYSVFVSINSGAYDKQVVDTLKMLGNTDKATENMLKAQFAEQKAMFTGYTTAQLIQEMLTALFLAAALIAAAVFIMRFVCSGKVFFGICSAAAIVSLCGIGSVIPNAVAAIIVTAAIGVAALIFAVRMKEQVVQPEKKIADDPFLNSIANAQKDE